MELRQQFEGRVRALSSEGWGVVDHPEGMVFFVPGTWPGDLGLYEIISKKKRYGEARLVRLIEASTRRRKTLPCAFQGVGEGHCGGCPWMIAEYEDQLLQKQERVEFQALKSGILPQNNVKKYVGKIWSSAQEFGFRNRAQFKTNGFQLGFVSERSHNIVNVEKCVVLNDSMQSLLKDARNLLPNSDWKPLADKPWQFLDLDDEVLQKDEFVLNKKRPFKQGNELQNQKMRNWIGETLLSYQPQSVIELFCGGGNFTGEILKVPSLKKVFVADWVTQGIEKLSKPTGVEFEIHEFNLFEPKLVRQFAGHIMRDASLAPDCLVLDPPRQGFALLGEFVSKLKSLQTLFYVSCDLATFLRDASELKRLGFVLDHLQPLDLFPHTPHVEILGKFSRMPTRYS